MSGFVVGAGASGLQIPVTHNYYIEDGGVLYSQEAWEKKQLKDQLDRIEAKLDRLLKGERS